jgi:hypothetical protein
LAEEVFEARDEAALFVVRRKVTVEAMGQSFLLARRWFLRLGSYPILHSLVVTGVKH